MKTTILLVTLLSIHENAATSGKATMYGGNLEGNACGMTGTAAAFDDWKYVAIGSTNFDDGYGCGKCYQITCIGGVNNDDCSCSGTITVQAIDQCPECDDDHFDLNADALTFLAGSSSMAGTCGVVEIEYERVDCSAITSNFYIKTKSGTSQWWFGFHLNDVNDDGGISKIEMLNDGATVATCTKSEGPSFWYCGQPGGSLPYDLKITSDAGKSVTAAECIKSFNADTVMECNTNLGGGSTSGTTDDDTSESESESESEESLDGEIQIKQNANVNEWWYAIELENGDSSSFEKIEFRDSNHGSWITGSKQDWEGTIAYSFSDGTKFSGSQHFRTTDDDGNTASTWNVFTGLSGGSTAYINLPTGSSYTEEDGGNTSSFPIAAIIAILLLVCILTGVAAYFLIKRRKQKSAVSFDNKETGDTEDSDARPMQDGAPTKSDTPSTGYDMSPIDTTV